MAKLLLCIIKSPEIRAVVEILKLVLRGANSYTCYFAARTAPSWHLGTLFSADEISLVVNSHLTRLRQESSLFRNHTDSTTVFSTFSPLHLMTTTGTFSYEQVITGK